MKPPYLYIIINAIIITIAVSLHFHQATSSLSIPSERLVSVKTPPSSNFTSFPDQSEISVVNELPLLECESENRIAEVKVVLLNGAKVDVDQTEEEIDVVADA
ncbi:uncharacterized protein Fot_38861 [Forsythia ovata]|uniref:DUF4408 domain-containing protein n=1 Tax=Forsythia ovata TaxID=205694 RepID=A0ABD1S4L1_9LAMI